MRHTGVNLPRVDPVTNSIKLLKRKGIYVCKTHQRATHFIWPDGIFALNHPFEFAKECVTTSQTFLWTSDCVLVYHIFFLFKQYHMQGKKCSMLMSVETNQRRKPLPMTAALWNYTWIGNHWFPPSGVEQLPPQRLQQIFVKENTVWWGDSTARQDYHTMHACDIIL